MNVTNSPFLIPDEVFQSWFDTDYAYYDNIFLAQTYGWIIVVLGCTIMSYAGMLRLLKRMTASNLTPSSKLTKFVQRHVTLPALFGKAYSRRRSVLGFQFSIPSRLETLFLFGYVAINVVFSFCSFKIFSGNHYWDMTIDQFQRYVADRTGILSFAQFPFLFAFAGRNTIFIWLTGWSYRSFSTFHKWVARMSVYHAFVHTVVYTIIYWKEGGAAELAEGYSYPYLRWGAVAMVAGFMLIAFSVATIRTRWYELFVLSHIILAVVWLVGSYYHVYLLDDPQYMPWIWVAVAFWGFDRTIRILRLLVINNSILHKKDESQTTVTALPDSVLRLSIPVSNCWTLVPGQYVFLYFPSFKFWQSHPFTIVDISASSPSIAQLDGTGEKSTASATVTTDISDVKEVTTGKRMTILFRAHKGVTLQLLKHAHKNGSTFKTRALIEGPYGTSHNLEEFSTVILLAAGLGITAVIPFLMTLSPHDNSQRVLLHWVVRRADSVVWFKQELERALQQAHGKVSVTIHVSGMEEREELAASSKQGKCMVFEPGRPTVQQLITSDIEESCGARERIGILACGPGGFMDDARDGVVRALGDGTGRAIEYFEESFTW